MLEKYTGQTIIWRTHGGTLNVEKDWLGNDRYPGVVTRHVVLPFSSFAQGARTRQPGNFRSSTPLNWDEDN
jgi:hypothetical protein